MNTTPLDESLNSDSELLPEYHFDYKKAKPNRFIDRSDKEKITMEKVVTKVKKKQQKSDFDYWQKQPLQKRLEALEEIRKQYHQYKYNAEHPPNRIDLITTTDGIGFVTCYQAKIEIIVDNITVNFIDLDNLIKNKQASGRLQDLADS